MPTGNDSIGVRLNLGFTNPNNFNVVLKKVEGDIFVNGDFIGQYRLDTLLKIDKKSAFDIPAALTVSKQVLYKNAWNSLLQKEVLLEVKGYSKVGKSGIFIRLPFDYKGNQRIPFL
ncbi:LEA type 2 family protein [Hydrotalea sp.]|uniref:NDR1/HIN1-like protein n=1 Tax=Hydrotalea sp. TaxID=2881279 RepID=UPI002619D2B0|nr:LEA type 2 family protein [Hydrotalea sp.]